MKRILTTLSMIVLAMFILVGCTPEQTVQTPVNNEPTNNNPTTPTQSQTFNVEISGFSFNPKTVTIKEGDSVTWTNLDTAPHNLDFNSFVSETMNKGGQYTRRFDTKGTYDYICGLHPSMTGKIIVE